MPLIMVGQNLQGRHAEMRPESDYDVNVKSERQITVLLLLLQQQQAMLISVMDHLDLDSLPPLEVVSQPSDANWSEQE